MHDRGEHTVSMDDQEIQQIHGSLFNDMHHWLPALGGRIFTTRRAFIISPFDRLYRAWETFLAIPVVYTAWVIPFEFGFLERPTRALSIADYIVCGLFAIDIVLNFFVAYVDKTKDLLIDNPKQIACKYMTTWFAFDVLSTIPLELARKILPPFLQSYDLFSLLRLWHLRRVYPLFARLEKDTQLNFIGVQYAKLICVTLFWIHCAGCFYYLLAANYDDPKNTWIGASNDKFHETSLLNQYVTSMYWSITTFTTLDNGYLPKNTWERIFISFYGLANFGLVIYLGVKINKFVRHPTPQSTKIKEDVPVDSSFIKRLKLSPNQDIQLELSHLLGKVELLGKVYLFHGLSNEVLLKLVYKMEVQNFPLNGNVIQQNYEATDIYILADGAADFLVINNEIEEVIREAKIGDIFGEIGALYNMRHLYTHMEELEQTYGLRFPTRGLDLYNSNYSGHTALTTVEASSNSISFFHPEADGQTSRDLAEQYAGLILKI